MDKHNKKRNRFNALVINELSDRHGFTSRFVRQCLCGERHSRTAETICREYKDLVQKVDKALNQ